MNLHGLEGISKGVDLNFPLFMRRAVAQGRPKEHFEDKVIILVSLVVSPGLNGGNGGIGRHSFDHLSAFDQVRHLLIAAIVI